MISDQEISLRISNLINKAGADFGRRARLAIQAAVRPGRTIDEVRADVANILEDYESRADEERERIRAERQRQIEADRQAAADLAREKAFAAAYERARSPREIVELCDRAGIKLELVEGDRIGICGGPISQVLDALIRVNRERMVEYLRARQTVTAII